jgi:plasmid maintenance system antidote protein VapI
MKKKITTEFDMEDGRMTSGSVDTSSQEYKETLAAMFTRVQERSPAQHLAVEMTALQVKMKKYLETPVKNTSEVQLVHDFYKELLKIANVSQTKVASYIDVKPSNLGTMFKAAKVNYKVARTFESIFHIEYTLWLDIQSKNEKLANPESPEKHYSDYSYEELMG